MKILLVRMSCIGDMLHATAVAKALKERMPSCTIVWIATPCFASILENNPYVDEVIEWARDDFENYARKGKAGILWDMWTDLRSTLRPYQFDLAIDVQGLLISGLVMLASGAKRKIGMGGTKELNWLFSGEKCNKPYKHVTERYTNVLSLIGVEVNHREMVLILSEEEKAWAREYTRASKRPVLAFVLGSSWPAKNWDLDHWKRLLELAYEEYDVVFVGGRLEKFFGDELTAYGNVLMREKGRIEGQLYNAVGETNLRQTAAILDRSCLVVTPDTGSLHIAVALGKPTVSFFGPTDPVAWGPLGTDQHIVLREETLSCLNCRKRRCPKEGHPCMTGISAERAMEAIERLLNLDKA